MRLLLAAMLLVSVPFAVWPQKVDRKQQNDIGIPSTPPMPPDEQPPPDDTVTQAPLPPPENPNPSESNQDLVPNPLDSPNPPAGPAPSKDARQQGQPQRGGWVQMGGATLQALDKVNAIPKTLVLRVGDTGHFGTLDITVRGCFIRTPDRPADATAFLVIHDKRSDAPGFSGWMVRSAPYMSMMAHPIFDIRVAGCTP